MAIVDLGRTQLSEIKGAPGKNHQPHGKMHLVPGLQNFKKLNGLAQSSLPMRLVKQTQTSVRAPSSTHIIKAVAAI